MTQRKTPPFRADHVGSLLRTTALKEARAKRARNEIDAAALTAVEDREIEKIVRKQEGIKISEKVEFAGHQQIEHFRFLKAHCQVVPKMCIPAPSTFHFRQGRALVSKDVYPDVDQFFADVGAAWRKAIRAFYDAGCRYLQLDDTAWAMMCDPNEREQ